MPRPHFGWGFGQRQSAATKGGSGSIPFPTPELARVQDYRELQDTLYFFADIFDELARISYTVYHVSTCTYVFVVVSV